MMYRGLWDLAARRDAQGPCKEPYHISTGSSTQLPLATAYDAATAAKINSFSVPTSR